MAERQSFKNRNSSNRAGKSQSEEFEQSIIDIARVTRVMAGGKRMRFRACVIIGNKNGKVGNAVAKGADVTIAVNKAATKARKTLISVPIINETIPHQISYKYGAARVLFKPAPKGSGIIAGGAVRQVLELAGVSNVVAKILGSKNKINNVKATLEALKRLKRIEPRKPVEGKIENSKQNSDNK